MKIAGIAMLALLTVVLMSSASEAGWLIYHEPEFKGTILDIETKQPIEGAVVVAVYRKETLGLGAGTVSSIVNVRETLTDKEGNFRIPSYTTFIQPFSTQIPSTFIVFKPGYGSFPSKNVYPYGLSLPDQEVFFSTGVGAERLFSVLGSDWQYQNKLIKTGVVELPKLKTREERRLNIPSLPSELDFLDKQKELIRLINEEEENLGLQKTDPYKARELILKTRR